MQYTTTDFKDQIRQPDRVWKNRLRVYDGATGDLICTLEDVLGGKVTVDSGSSTRRQLSIELVNVDPIWEEEPTDPASNEYGDGDYGDGFYSDTAYTQLYGALVARQNHIYAEQGLLVDGEYEWVDLGWFVIQSCDGSYSADTYTFKVDADDRSCLIREWGWDGPYVIAPATNVVTAMTDLAESHYPYTLDVDAFATSSVTGADPLVYFGSEDPWSKLEELATSIGYEVFFSAAGSLIIQEVPTPSDTPVAEYVPTADDMRLSLSRTINADNTYSGVLAVSSSQASEGSVGALVMDEDPSSPTYYLGSFGRKVLYVESDAFDTWGGANSFANTMLSKVTGWDEKVTLTMPKDPSLDVGDVILIQEARLGMNNPAKYVVEAIDLPLGLEAMQVTCRRRVNGGE